MKLDKRLSAVAGLINECETVADIGSDHAYLPTYLLLNKKAKRAIVADINKGPLENGEKTCRMYGVHDKCDFRLGSGMSVLEEGDADVITICGMGGELMTDIILNDMNIAKNASYLILQPQSAYDMLTKCLYDNGFGILDEKIVKDKHLYYRIILAKYGAERIKDDFLYPGRLAQRGDMLYKEFLEFRLKVNNGILEKISSGASSNAKAQISSLEEENNRIKGVLAYYESPSDN